MFGEDGYAELARAAGRAARDRRPDRVPGLPGGCLGRARRARPARPLLAEPRAVRAGRAGGDGGGSPGDRGRRRRAGRARDERDRRHPHASGRCRRASPASCSPAGSTTIPSCGSRSQARHVSGASSSPRSGRRHSCSRSTARRSAARLAAWLRGVPARLGGARRAAMAVDLVQLGRRRALRHHAAFRWPLRRDPPSPVKRLRLVDGVVARSKWRCSIVIASTIPEESPFQR